MHFPSLLPSPPVTLGGHRALWPHTPPLCPPARLSTEARLPWAAELGESPQGLPPTQGARVLHTVHPRTWHCLHG